MNREKHIVILGNGITGVTAARHIRKRSDDRITLISGETEHHFSRTALMYIYMGDLTYNDTKPYEDRFWSENRIDLKHGWVTRIDTAKRQLEFAEGPGISYDELIITTGSKPNRFGWPGEDLPGVQGLYSMQDLETMERNSAGARHAVIVGGGLIGIEVAEMLLTRNIAVTFLVREKTFWGSVLPSDESALVNDQIRQHGITLKLESSMEKVLPGPDGRAAEVVTSEGETINCQMVFLTAGVSPNINMVKVSGIECDKGVLVDEHFATSALNVWAGGDCAQHRKPPKGRRPVEQVWYTGRVHGEHIAANLYGDPAPYQPGIWFNSAKFFDVEYQTYGNIPPQPGDLEEDFFWKHPTRPITLRIRFESQSGAVTGMNVFGLRQRHELWENWIMKGTPIHEVIAHLAAANFDQEFQRQHEALIIAAFNAQFPALQVEQKTGKGLFSNFMRAFRQSPTPVHS